jgi:hypothetical protein
MDSDDDNGKPFPPRDVNDGVHFFSPKIEVTSFPCVNATYTERSLLRQVGCDTYGNIYVCGNF